MVTVTCQTEGCPEYGIDSNFGGQPPEVECGGCRQMMTPRDYREGPEQPIYPLGVFPE